jgi:type VI secretion system protein ImpL
MRAFLLSAPATAFVAALLLSLCIWFVGPLLPIGQPRLFDPISARLVAIGIVFLVYLVFVGVWAWRRNRRNARLIDAVAEPDPTAAAIDAEGERLRAKFAEAMSQLKKLRFGGRRRGSRTVYELPWFVFIGPPQSGKTTALLKADLGDPLKRGEKIALEGAQGTRDCDWMFTDHAVFIDTAGRYVTQDSDAQVDRSAWTTFLKLLKKHRPAEPINGVIVAISASDLALADEARLMGHADAIRNGVLEIMKTMGARVPVYAMFTKADLLAGFDVFFQTMNDVERAQVWGATFPLDPKADARQALSANLAALEPELEALLARLGDRALARMQDAADSRARAQVFAFPSQFSSFAPVAAGFLRRVFEPDAYSDPILFRGFYFTSATQEGQPIDRLIGAMAREFGIDPHASPALAGRSPREYFLRGLLTDVVFPESGLVARGRRRLGALIGRGAAFTAAIALPVALGAGWWTVESQMKAETDAFLGDLAAYETQIAALGPEAVNEDLLTPVIGPLNLLRDARDRLEAAEPPFLGLGAADMDALRAQAERAYAKGLDDLLRPRLLFRLERLMYRNIDAPAPLYNALKTYLMLGKRGPLDRNFVVGEIRRDWTDRFDIAQASEVAMLSGHLDALLDGMERGLIRERDQLNNALIESARLNAQNVDYAERAYGILMAQDEVRTLPPWSVLDERVGALGVETAFLRLSGADLGAPIAGIFTFEGFWSVFAPNVDAAVAAALSENWVLTEAGGPDRDAAAAAVEARRKIRRIYADDYIAAWKALLGDLRIVPFSDADHAKEVLRNLASAASPLRRVLEAAARETALTERREEAAALFTAAERIDFGAGAGAAGAVGSAAALAGLGGPKEGEAVTQAFADLRAFVFGGGEASALSATLNRLGDLRTLATDLADRRVADLSQLAQSDAALALSRETDTAPREVREMMADMLASFESAVGGGLRAQLSEIWSSTVARVCRQRLTANYPFSQGADDIPLRDFADILGPDGLIDTFFRTRLATMVETSGPEWRWSGLGLSLGLPKERLAFFQMAAKLRDAFFPDGGGRPNVRMDADLVAMSPGVRSGEFELGGEVAAFELNKREVYTMSWPGPSGPKGAEAVLMIDTGATDISGAPLPPSPERLSERGEWGLFRLIDQRDTEFGLVGAGDRARLGFSSGGRRMVIELRMDSATNPLALRADLAGFRCPETL